MAWGGSSAGSRINPGYSGTGTPAPIHESGHEATTERGVAERLRYQRLLGQLSRNENWRTGRIARLGRFVGRAGRLGAGLAQVGWNAGGEFLQAVIPPEIRKSGILSDFARDMTRLHGGVLRAAQGIWAQGEHLRALFGNLGASGLKEGEVMKLNRAIAEHQNAIITNGTGSHDDIRTRLGTCKNLLDTIESLMRDYDGKYASSHLLQGLHETINDEYNDLVTALGHSQERQRVVEKYNNQNTNIDSTIGTLRSLFGTYSTLPSRSKQIPFIKAQQDAIFASYEPQVRTLRTAFRDNVDNLLARMDRQMSSPGAIRATIVGHYEAEISRLKQQTRNRTMYETGWNPADITLDENVEEWTSPAGTRLAVPNITITVPRIRI